MSSQPRPRLNDELFANLPRLPAVIRYYDDFADAYVELRDPERFDQWIITFDGHSATLDFADFDTRIRGFVKAWCALVLGNLSPTTAYKYLAGLRSVPIDRTIGLMTCSATNVRSQWKLLHASDLAYPAFVSLSSLLAFLCRVSVANWGAEWLDLISQLPLPKKDKYASVRVGDVFLSAEEEAAIVRHIDKTCAQLQLQRSSIPDEMLEATAILACSFQFTFRAKQIAMLGMRNIRIWEDGIEAWPAVHLTFTMIKQRSAKRVFPMVRRVKREWSSLFVEVVERAKQKGLAGAGHVFQRIPLQIGQVIADLTESLGCRRTVTELRHSAAQRMVDAGATEEELAAFMGHTDLNTGLVYFNSSRSQAERINQALGISSTYQNVMKVAHSQFISDDELAGLKGDQQIAGVPHGIPIAGIGGCELGQPDLLEVMKLFYVSSHAERGSPALQLESTIDKVQAVIDELGGQLNELES